MNKNKRIISILLVVLLALSYFPVHAENISLETDEVVLKADSNEITNSIETTAAWKAHLQKVNQAPKKEDLLHDNIQAVLKERGISGLSKYQ